MSDEALLGVVEPELPEMPPHPPDRAPNLYEETRDKALLALGLVEERLGQLRKQRDEVNAEVKSLVEQHELLTRMSRVSKGRKA